MKLIERFIQSKSPEPESCEDGVVFTDRHAAVIDGATNKSGVTFGSISPGRIAMLLVSEAVGSFEPEITPEGALERINDRIRSWYERQGVLETVRTHPASRCTASLVIYSERRRELWFIGDCQALVDGTAYQFHKEADRVLSDLRALILHAELAKGTTERELMKLDLGRERILEFLNLQTQLQNSPYECEFTYHVVDGFSSDPARQITVVPVRDSTAAIVLASDGYPRLFPTLAESESFLAELLEQDPLCFRRWRSTKGRSSGNLSFDDRAYLRVAL
jgi:hypothetical protein